MTGRIYWGVSKREWWAVPAAVVMLAGFALVPIGHYWGWYLVWAATAFNIGMLLRQRRRNYPKQR